VSNSIERTPTVSVLIPLWNEERHLPAALIAMRKQTLGGEVEFLFIDGSSTDRTRDMIAAAATSDARIRLLNNPKRTIPNGLNIGLRAARGEFVARMDAHTIYPPGYLEAGVTRLRAGGTVCATGPALAVGDSLWSVRIARALQSPLGVGGATFRKSAVEEVEVDSGFTGVWRRDLLVTVGGWDEGWPVNQDAELAARIRDTGGVIVCMPTMSASYIPRDSLRSLAKQYRRYGYYRAKTSQRHPTSMRRSHTLPPALLVVWVSAALPGRLGRLPRLAVLGYLGGITVGARAVARDQPMSEQWGVARAMMTMHLAWAIGFVHGAARFRLPVSQLIRTALGLRR
jgi:succinoglycan biosynthesis protein ExoA